MPNGFLHGTDVELLEWSRMFAAKIAIDPPALGLSAAVVNTFAGLTAEYTAAMAAIGSPERSATTTIWKNSSRAALIADAQQIVRTINGRRDVSDLTKFELGLPVRRRPTKGRAPDGLATIDIGQVVGHTVAIRIGSTDGGRAKPEGTVGATVFGYAGETLPDSGDAWTFLGNFSRTRVSIEFPTALPPGTRVWLVARWMNTRLEPGAMGLPVCTNLQGGTVSLDRAA